MTTGTEARDRRKAKCVDYARVTPRILHVSIYSIQLALTSSEPVSQSVDRHNIRIIHTIVPLRRCLSTLSTHLLLSTGDQHHASSSSSTQHEQPEMCGLRTRPSADADPQKFFGEHGL